MSDPLIEAEGTLTLDIVVDYFAEWPAQSDEPGGYELRWHALANGIRIPSDLLHNAEEIEETLLDELGAHHYQKDYVS